MKARRTPFAMVPLWVYDHPDVTGTVLQVYLGAAALAYDRAAHRSVAEIGERAGLAKSATYTALGVLASIGAVEREGRDMWFLPMDEPNDNSATVDEDSATAENASATAERTLTRDPSRGDQSARAEARAQFADYFWPSYPTRSGRKIGKAEALAQWERLSIDDRRAALRGARIMAADVAAGRTIPPDAHRWLRKRTWEDWQDPAVLDSAPRRGQQTMADAHDVIERGVALAVAAGVKFDDDEGSEIRAIG